MNDLLGKPPILRHRITREMRRQLDHLDAVALDGDWVACWDDGECIDSDEAAFIAGTSRQTIRRRADAAATAGKPIGVLLAKSVWLISLQRLLRWIELNEGLPERVAAERRVKKVLDDRAAPKIDVTERGATG